MTSLYAIIGAALVVLVLAVLFAYVNRKRGEATAGKKHLEEKERARVEFERRGEKWDAANPMGKPVPLDSLPDSERG